MDSLNRPWNWIWVMELSLKIWMVWSLIMAICSFLVLLSLMFFNLWLSAFDWSSLPVMFETSQPASLAQECLFDDHLRFLLSIFWPDISGMMRKVCYDQTFFLFLDAVDRMLIYVYVLHCVAEVCSVTKMLCKWCLLILLNNKDWYFFLWKK